jgi:Rrf2 family protein
MFKINRKMEYGLMALKHMLSASADHLTSAKEICQVYGVSFDAMAKVLQQLTQAGWLQGVQGSKGGYQIQKDLSQSTFLDLTEVLVGPVTLVNCLNHDDDCSMSGSCNVISPMKRLNDRVKDFYHQITIAELVEEGPNSFKEMPKQQSF